MKSTAFYLIISLIYALGMNACSSAKPIQTNAVSTVSVAPPKSTAFMASAEDKFIENLMRNGGLIAPELIDRTTELNLQVIYSEVLKPHNGGISLIHHSFNRANARYFYPASTVKLPIVILALQRLNELKDKGIDANSTMVTEAAYSGQTAVYNEPNSADGRPTIANYIKKILLVSDNDAYNRLYEFLGQEYINSELQKRGFKEAQILHRLDAFLSPDENRHTNPVKFYDTTGRLLYSQPMQVNRKVYDKRHDLAGNAYYDASGRLHNGAMDFSQKNRISLQSLHDMLISVIMPQQLAQEKRFNISEADRSFLMQWMSAYPAESQWPAYDNKYYDAYVKFLLFGSEKKKLPENIRIYNKVGNAYGQLIDVAYILDTEKNIGFFLSAAINCDTDGVLNDDKYDYNGLGYPFMKNLGQTLYDFELKKKRP